MRAMMPRIARTVVSVWMRTSEDLTRRRSATAGPPRRVNCGKLCFTLNYHLSTLNFLSTAASGSLQRLVRRLACLLAGVEWRGQTPLCEHDAKAQSRLAAELLGFDEVLDQDASIRFDHAL